MLLGKKKKIGGKRKFDYKIALLRRGCVNAAIYDIVVKFRTRIVERIGFGRIFRKKFCYMLAGDRLALWMYKDVFFTNGFKKFLKKISSSFF